jgi:hypothetical protein
MSLKPSPGSLLLSQGNIVQSFALPQTDAYDIQACVVGSSLSSSVSVTLPASVGGVMNITLAGKVALIDIGAESSSMAFWLELYSPYSYQTNGGSIMSNQLVARTDVLTSGSNSTHVSTPLVENIPMRSGRYLMRTYYRTTSGLTVREDSFLLTDEGAWLSLDSCSPLADVVGQSFQTSSDLMMPTQDWPRSLFTMYDINGVEGYSEIPIAADAATVNLRTTSANASLQGVQVSASGAGIEDWDSFGGSVYLIAGTYPLEVSIVLSFSGVATEESNITIPQPYARATASFAAGTLVATAARGGQQLADATFTVSHGSGGAVRVNTDKAGRLTVPLPPGNYTVVATYAGVSSSHTVTVVSGHLALLAFSLGAAAFPVLLCTILAVGAVGVALNVLAWRRYFHQRNLYG